MLCEVSRMPHLHTLTASQGLLIITVYHQVGKDHPEDHVTCGQQLCMI